MRGRAGQFRARARIEPRGRIRQIGPVRTIAGTLALAALVAPPAAGQEVDPSDAVASYDPAFRPAGPDLTLTADLDGDGRTDVAAIVTDGSRRALVVFHRRSHGWLPIPLYAPLPAGPVEVRILPPGRHRVLGPEGAVRVEGPSIELVFPGRSSAIYVWRGDRYVAFPTERY